jgi:hypothetical protein
MCLIRVSLKKRGKLVCAPLTFFKPSHPLLYSFLKHLSQGSTDVPTMQADVTQARDAAAAAEATHVMVVLAAETSAHEAATTWDSTSICIKDVEDRSTLVEREARKRVSRVEMENIVMLASAHEGAEGLVRKIALLEGELAEACWARDVVGEKSCVLFDAVADAKHRWKVYEKGHREHFEELTLLQTRGFKLCFAIVDPPQVRNHLLEGVQIAALRPTEMVRELATLRSTVSSAVEMALECSSDETI